MRKLSILLVTALLGGALLVACGSKSSTSTQTSTTSNGGGSAGSGGNGSGSTGSGGNGSGSATSSGKGSGSGGATSTTPVGTAEAAHPLPPAQEIANCKTNIKGLQGVSASTKKKLEESCDKAKTSKAQRVVVHEACEALANRFPAGAARERALQVCRRAP
jgi:hypothetical protein